MVIVPTLQGNRVSTDISHRDEPTEVHVQRAMLDVARIIAEQTGRVFACIIENT